MRFIQLFILGSVGAGALPVMHLIFLQLSFYCWGKAISVSILTIKCCYDESSTHFISSIFIQMNLSFSRIRNKISQLKCHHFRPADREYLYVAAHHKTPLYDTDLFIFKYTILKSQKLIIENFECSAMLF